MARTMDNEARNALRRARTTWTALREQMGRNLHLRPSLRAKFLADTVTDDGYLASYIADKLHRTY